VAVNISDPSTIAAAGPLRATAAVDANGQPTNVGTGEITQPEVTDLASVTDLPLSASRGNIKLTFNPAAGGVGVPGFDVTADNPGLPALPAFLLYEPGTESAGKALTFNAGTLGDMSFSVSGIPATGDSFVITDNTAAAGDNRNALSLATIQQSQTMINGTASIQESYSQMVGSIGADTRRSEINMESHRGLLDQAILTRDSASGVNLDEEAADLLRYQQAYQAAAQVVSVASTLFDTLIAAVRR
jgi:flagellar hook-associated protein 1 FlgK